MKKTIPPTYDDRLAFTYKYLEDNEHVGETMSGVRIKARYIAFPPHTDSS
jgi:hypothetical protein